MGLTVVAARFTLWQPEYRLSCHNCEATMMRKSAVAAMLAAFAALTMISAVHAAPGGTRAVHVVSMCGGGMSQGSDSC
jgi:hypothetical protein